MCADIPQWGRQSSALVPYLRTQTRGHRKRWSTSTILWAKHSKFPNLLIKKQYAKPLSFPLQPQQSPKGHPRKFDCIRLAVRAFCRRRVLGCASTGFHLTTQHRISHTERQCLTQCRTPHAHRMAIASAFFSLLWRFRFYSSDEHRHVSECCQTSAWVNPGSPCPQLCGSGRVT